MPDQPIVTELPEAGEHRDQLPGATSNQALARGLHILRMLVDEGAPLTATEIARRMGLHQSSASRILATLTEAGYARKNSAGRFVPDYGVLALASATTRLPLISRARLAFDRFVEDNPTMSISMCMLWRDELIYLLRGRHGAEPLSFWSGGFPINISSPGLRLLVDLPEADAVQILAASRARHGWGGRPAIVPDTEAGVLAAARDLLKDDVLVLDGWYVEGKIGAAINLETPEPHPVSLAIVDDEDRLSADDFPILLHRARRDVERCFTAQ
jgi:IclR family pca regulon transcriptional regulator